jgi:6-phosphogluconolactonase
MAWTEHTYPDAGALAEALAAELAHATREALAARGTALLSLAGGRTPLPAYRDLALLPLAWSKVVVMPGDDRCVPHEHPASNVRELRTLVAAAPGSQVQALTTPEGDPDASEAYARALLAGYRDVPFDATVLGMGADAHTASLFPNARQLEQGLDRASTLEALRIDPDPLPPEAPFPRISLTAARLLRSRALHLVVTGSAKRAVLDQVYASAEPMRQPVAAILHAPGARVHVHWSP